MRIVFVELNGAITANGVPDSVAVGMANMVWQNDVRPGEVVAEVSVRTYDDPLTDGRSEFYEEMFELGRQYERKRQQHAWDETHDIVD